MSFHLRLVVAALAAAFSLPGPPAAAQSYPTRTISLVVAYSAGGTGDVVARTISNQLASALGQSVVVENRPGASGAIGAQSVARATPDGHTILVGQTAEMVINQHLMKGIGYDPDKDLMPVALGADVPLALVVPANSPYNNVSELLAGSRTANGLTYASAGTGTPGQFAAELLKAKTQSNLVHVPYKGAGPALNDIIGGHVDMYFSGFPAAMPQAKAGQVKVLALSSAKRSPIAPEIPTISEVTSIKDFDLTLWVGFFVPHGTPEAVIVRLNREINSVLSQPDVRAKLLDAGAVVTPLTIEATAGFMESQSKKYQQIIQETGVKID